MNLVPARKIVGEIRRLFRFLWGLPWLTIWPVPPVKNLWQRPWLLVMQHHWCGMPWPMLPTVDTTKCWLPQIVRLQGGCTISPRVAFMKIEIAANLNFRTKLNCKKARTYIVDVSPHQLFHNGQRELQTPKFWNLKMTTSGYAFVVLKNYTN